MLQRAALVRTLLAVLWVAGCDADHSKPNTKVDLSVFAASSLTEAFQELERGFEVVHPDVDVQLTFAGSQVLRLQIEQGAAPDVFASANENHMQALIDAGHVAGSQVFARNELVIIVPTNNPAGIDALADLGNATRIVIGTDNVPVGIYTRQFFDRAGRELGQAFIDDVKRRIVSEESNARLVRAKVEMGEVDAAIVYRTDALPSDRARVVSIPSALNVVASYPIGSLTGGPHKAEARAFIAYLLSPLGRETLARHGFLTEGE